MGGDRMKRDNYYLASRDPSKGGLKIIKTDRKFPAEYAEAIEKNCLEIVVPEYTHNALLIYPLENGKNVVSLARKVKGSEWEPRIHENIHGYVVDMETFSEEYVNAIAQKNFDDCFYNGKMAKAMKLPDETFCYRPLEHNAGTLEQFWLAMSFRDRVGFFYAVYRVVSEGRKIQLTVPAPVRRVVQAACYAILPYYCRNKLFTISGGECTQSDADILFVDEIQYQDAGKYKKMDLRDFMEEGLEWRKRNFIRMDQLIMKETAKREDIYAYMSDILKEAAGNADKKSEELLSSIALYDLLMELIIALEKPEYQKAHREELIQKFESVTAGNKKIQELLCKEFQYLIPQTETESLEEAAQEGDLIAVCIDYVIKTNPSKTVISAVRNRRYENGELEGWGTFQKELRLKLEEMPLLQSQRENYVSVLFLAYEYCGGRCVDLNPAVLPGPYDLEGMLLFLLQKTRSQWEYKKYAEEVLRQYTEVFLLYLPKRRVKRTVRKIRGRIVKNL